ncbi:unnamed protein product [Trichobilharzia regenti]|nr:unnamed protein product [Trichobilharzia regenti]
MMMKANIHLIQIRKTLMVVIIIIIIIKMIRLQTVIQIYIQEIDM